MESQSPGMPGLAPRHPRLERVVYYGLAPYYEYSIFVSPHFFPLNFNSPPRYFQVIPDPSGTICGWICVIPVLTFGPKPQSRPMEISWAFVGWRVTDQRFEAGGLCHFLPSTEAGWSFTRQFCLFSFFFWD